MKRLLLLFALILGMGVVAEAQQYKISVQGTLKDANGQALEDGEVDVTFRLYDVQTGGSSVWQEAATVTLQGGVYSHKLGSVENLTPTIFGSTLYLGVTTSGGQELEPRTELTYAPYAVSVATTQVALEISTEGCSGALGDIKYSILAPDDFAQVNGDCWVLMSGQSYSGSALHDMIGNEVTVIPNMSGHFIRAMNIPGFNNGNNNRDPQSGRQVGSEQSDLYKEHFHTMQGAGDHTHTHTDSYVNAIIQRSNDGANATFAGTESAQRDGESGKIRNDGNGSESLVIRNENDDVLTTGSNGSHTHTINSAGGAETRPWNRAFYCYIRIN